MKKTIKSKNIETQKTLLEKILKIGMMGTFIITIISTIPLFIKYLTKTTPNNMLVVHVHVWFGLAFIMVAICRMIVLKRNEC